MIDQEIINDIKDIANDKIELVLSELGIDIDNFRFSTNYISGPCPIHDGDNQNAFSYSVQKKIWKCFTKGCDEKNKSIFGLVSAILSKNTGKHISFIDSVKWLSNILHVNINEHQEIKSEYNDIIVDLIKKSKIQNKIINSIDTNQNNIICKAIPIEYLKNKIKKDTFFLKQGFTEKILEKFYIGYCDTLYKKMFNRSYALVLDESGKLVIGTTGRINLDQCQICGSFHQFGRGCPSDNKNVRSYPKWLHDGFQSSKVLYNSWNAIEYIKQTKLAILTEGPKDVWWLEQNGIHNACCVFGLNISEYHINKLIQMGALRIVIALNNDERGLDAIEKLTPILSNYFKVVNMSHLFDKYKDLAEMSPEYIEENIKPFLNSLEYKLT